MLLTNVRTLLINLALKEKEGNKIAKILAYYFPTLNLVDKKALFESLFYYYQISDSSEINFDKIIQEVETENELENLKGKDFRIKSMEASDLRGIPEKDKNGISFGIDFFENGIINNAIILANNGMGKSSIFAGLEMIFAQEIGEKQLRTTNPDNLKKSDYDNYLKRFPDGIKPMCSIETNEGVFNLNNVVFTNERTRKLLNPSNHFISDYDIYHYGQKEYDGDSENKNSFHSLIAYSLGLNEFVSLQSLLKEVSNYRRNTESTALNKLNTQNSDAIRNIKNFEAEIQSKNIGLNELKEKPDINKAGDNKLQNERTKKLKELLNKSISYNIDKSEYLEALDNFRKIYNDSLSTSIIEKKAMEKDFLSAGIELIHEFDNCPFCQNSNKTLEEIQKDVEVRLKKLKESQKIGEELNQHFLNLANLIVDFYQNTSIIYNEISKERSEVLSFKELENLSKIEEQQYLYLSPLLNDEKLIEHLMVLNKKTYPNQEDYKSLFDIINHSFTVNNPEIIEKLKAFVEERKRILEKAIEGINNDSLDVTIEKQIGILEEDIKRIKEQIEASQKQIEVLKPQIEKAEKDVLLVTRIKKEVIEFVEPINVEINKLVNEAFIPIQDIVETILNDYLIDENIKLRIDRKEIKKIVDGEEIFNSNILAIIEFVDRETGEIKTITPDLYFNTFRYKLFCLMVSLSLALATRKKYKVNLPLVMDDLFFASDFISKNSFAEFLQKVIKQFYEHTPELPFQFILFTHDDLIFRSALDAIESFNIEIENQYCAENKKQLIEKTMIGRFFDPKDKDELPTKNSDDKEYWNLLYKRPKNINQLVNV